MFDQSKLQSVWLPSTSVLIDSALGTSYWFAGANKQHYHLLEEELPAVIKLFNAIVKLPQPKRQGLGTAIHRFNLAYARDYAEDVILDLAIALESSLLTGETNELTYKMALRGAALLADVMAPADTAAILKSFYSMRSQIVHEGKLIAELTKYTKIIASTGGPNEVAQRCIDMVREILKQYLVRLGASKSVAQINDQLEDFIVKKLEME